MGLITADDFPSLTELYIARLRYLLSTENQIIKALPKMIEHADDTQLKQAFQSTPTAGGITSRAVLSTGPPAPWLKPMN